MVGEETHRAYHLIGISFLLSTFLTLSVMRALASMIPSTISQPSVNRILDRAFLLFAKHVTVHVFALCLCTARQARLLFHGDEP